MNLKSWGFFGIGLNFGSLHTKRQLKILTRKIKIQVKILTYILIMGSFLDYKIASKIKTHMLMECYLLWRRVFTNVTSTVSIMVFFDNMQLSVRVDGIQEALH